MHKLTHRGETIDDVGAAPGHRTPRWVKVFGIIALVLVLLVAVMLLSGGNHGPGPHFGGDQSPARHAP